MYPVSHLFVQSAKVEIKRSAFAQNGFTSFSLQVVM